MLVKRKNLLSDVFDAYSENEGGEALWPEDEALPPAVEPSGYRPAPAGFNDAPASDITELDASTSDLTELDASAVTELDASTSDLTELDAPASAVPTPRRLLQWTLDEPDAESPLPVVTAATEPTQRGLGIPPPPSSREAAWFAELPSLASAPAPSPEAFTDRGTRQTGSEEVAREPSENERITVRAPAERSGGAFTRRRRAVALLLLSVGALFAGLAVRRATMHGAPDPSLPAPVRAAMAPVAVVPATRDERPSPHAEEARREAAPTRGAPEAQADPDSNGAAHRHRSGKESRREKARRKALALAKARSSVVRDVSAGSMPGPDLGPPAAEAKSPDQRQVLSLPPR